MTTNDQNHSSVRSAGGGCLVLDVGKTRSKLSLWSAAGRCLAQCARDNARVQDARGERVLDVEGIEAWLVTALPEVAAQERVGHLIVVGHGAAFVRLREGRRVGAPVDYEQIVPATVLEEYRAQRDAFAVTGSPALPQGLNLGAQLHALEAREPEAFAPGTQWLPWPQYWAWLFSGIAASEVTSLGCHTDLWNPLSAAPSPLSQRRGWAACMAPLRGAGEVLGPLTADWAQRTGLPALLQVHCGLHDSNAALLAARAALGGQAASGFTVLSTGTWFVALHSAATPVAIERLDPRRDVLVNVDASGRATPSARFMGGREIELLRGDATGPLDDPASQAAQIAALPSLLADRPAVLPSVIPHCGPFPGLRGGWQSRPAQEVVRRAAIALHLALMADVLLELLDSTGPVVVEGRFARSEVFVRALASLRPGQCVQVAPEGLDVALGALSLLPGCAGPQALPVLQPAVPLGLDIDQYRHRWRTATDGAEYSS